MATFLCKRGHTVVLDIPSKVSLIIQEAGEAKTLSSSEPLCPVCLILTCNKDNTVEQP